MKGFWYHGTKSVYKGLMLPRRYSPSEMLGFGIHFARDSDFARLYGNVIYRCRLHPERILDKNQPAAAGTPAHKMALELYRGSRHKLIYWKPGVKEYIRPEDAVKRKALFYLDPDVTSPKRAEALLRKHGFDAVRYRAEFGRATMSGSGAGKSISHATDAVVMLDPAKIEIVSVIFVVKPK